MEDGNRMADENLATSEVANELRIIEELLPPDNVATRRIAIRSLFASLEALASEVNSKLARRLPPPKGAKHEEMHQYFLELCALSDMSYQVNESGVLKVEAPRIRIKNRILFMLNICARSNGVDLNPRDIRGWSDFMPALKIRNRITHPKTKTDLLVSKEDYDTVVKATRWFVLCFHRACGGKQL